jgi:hypothetical protein
LGWLIFRLEIFLCDELINGIYTLISILDVSILDQNHKLSPSSQQNTLIRQSHQFLYPACSSKHFMSIWLNYWRFIHLCLLSQKKAERFHATPGVFLSMLQIMKGNKKAQEKEADSHRRTV